MLRITLATLGAAALFALSGTAATAQGATPYCSKTVTDNCMQREGHAAAVKHHAVPKHHAAAKHHAAKHRTAKHRVAAKHHRPAQHHAMAAKPAPKPARKM
jgi:hypothetical protein